MILTTLATQTLSIDPINGNIIELLNLALEDNIAAGIMGQKGVPGGDEEWSKKMREHRRKGKAVAKQSIVDDEMSL
jgi:anaphase-promoting complex subunit 6